MLFLMELNSSVVLESLVVMAYDIHRACRALKVRGNWSSQYVL